MKPTQPSKQAETRPLKTRNWREILHKPDKHGRYPTLGRVEEDFVNTPRCVNADGG